MKSPRRRAPHDWTRHAGSVRGDCGGGRASHAVWRDRRWEGGLREKGQIGLCERDRCIDLAYVKAMGEDCVEVAAAMLRCRLALVDRNGRIGGAISSRADEGCAVALEVALSGWWGRRGRRWWGRRRRRRQIRVLEGAGNDRIRACGGTVSGRPEHKDAENRGLPWPAGQLGVTVLVESGCRHTAPPLATFSPPLLTEHQAQFNHRGGRAPKNLPAGGQAEHRQILPFRQRWGIASVPTALGAIPTALELSLLPSLPGLTRQSILLIKSSFSDGCPGQARA